MSSLNEADTSSYASELAKLLPVKVQREALAESSVVFGNKMGRRLTVVEEGLFSGIVKLKSGKTMILFLVHYQEYKLKGVRMRGTVQKPKVQSLACFLI